MSNDTSKLPPFETLGLLSSADRGAIERRAEALSALLKLGVIPPDGDAIALCADHGRTPESVNEAAGLLRDPSNWLVERTLWPDCRTAGRALELAAELLEGATGTPADPASLVRHLALEYLTEELHAVRPTEQPAQKLEKLLAPPKAPGLHFGPGR